MVTVFCSPGEFYFWTLISVIYGTAETHYFRAVEFFRPETVAVADGPFYKSVFNGATSRFLGEGVVGKIYGDGITPKRGSDGAG